MKLMIASIFIVFTIVGLLSTNSTVFSSSGPEQNRDPLTFDDAPLREALELPDWFKLSFLDLNDSLNEAIDEDKAGLIIYFGRKDCPYCKYLLEGNWGDPAIVKYTQQHFNVIAIDVRGDRTVTDFNGQQWTEKTYSAHRKTNFTPSLLFYNAKGQLALKLPGYRPKYQFRASLEYVADAHYKRESFRSYLSRAESALNFGSEELNEIDLVLTAPDKLNRSTKTLSRQGRKPLLVFFEHPRCHACDVLHGDTLNQQAVLEQLKNLDVVQLNTENETPLINPAGQRTSPRQWAEDLGLTFAPALLFFDEQGNEILRVESVVKLNRLNKVLGYITTEAYKDYPTLQSWLIAKRTKNDLLLNKPVNISPVKIEGTDVK